MTEKINKQTGKPAPLTDSAIKAAELVVQGMSQADAYRKAYNKPANAKPETIWSNASALFADPRMTAHIARLRDQVVRDIKVSVEDHMAKLAELRDWAVADGKWAPAIKAEELRGQISGLYVTKTEDVTNPIQKALANMRPAQAEEMLNALDQLTAIKNKAKNAA